MSATASLWVRSEPFEFGIVPVPPPSKLVHNVSFIVFDQNENNISFVGY